MSEAKNEHDLVPRTRTLAKLYAKSILGAAQASGRGEALIADLEAFTVEVLDKYPEYEAILSSERVSEEEKTALLDRLLAGQNADLLLDTLKVLAIRDRLSYLRPIVRQARRSFEEAAGIVRVEVVTAVELGDELGRRIEDVLREALKIRALLVRKTQPEILGGLVVRIEDTVYDGSVQTQLVDLRRQLIQRSVHEIQSRRNRFGDPEGN